MADDEDEAQKTEEPTSRKLEKSKEQGQTASSQEIKTWGVLLTATLIIALMAPGITRNIRDATVLFIEQPHAIPADFEHLRLTLADLMMNLAWILAPLMMALMIVAVVMSLAQSGLIWAPTKIKPDFSKLSMIKGLKNKVNLKAMVEFVKGLLKLGLVSLVTFGIAIPLLDDVTLIPFIDLVLSLERIHQLIVLLAVGTLIVLTVIAVLDYMYQKYAFMEQMKMTKQEVRDEHKQSEGDPQIKARIRQLRTERARQRMMEAVPEADVVITNPTHYAVALKYKIEDMQAPRLVAKGVDNVAFRIRDVAIEHDIPIVENAPLARTLYAAVELDEEIPTEHYQAVAEVIGYVMRLRGDTVH